MARESDGIPDRVACLNTGALPATLISVRGFNCEVWQSAGVIVRDAERVRVNFVVKRHRFACPLAKVRAYQREYRRLRAALADMVPAAVFVATRVDGDPNVVVLAEARAPWFDLAQQGAEDEARPLLARMPRAREQLARFVAAARQWQREGLVVDLYGSENLVLDRDRQVRYLDSFGVFFYEDTLHAVDGADDEFAERIAVSRRRLDYVASLTSC
jgi:hypothetical protein